MTDALADDVVPTEDSGAKADSGAKEEVGAEAEVGTEAEAAADEAETLDVVAAPSGRRWRHRAVHIGVWTLATMVVVMLVATLGVIWEVRRAFPQYDGVLKVPGLSASVTVYRDSYAIPQIYAQSADDLFTAQGYVGAQERFWEMDFRRHVTSGRLAEMFGADQLSTDEYLRTMDWRGVAAQEWSLISPQSRQYLTDYANGVNDYLDAHSASAVSLEYSVLGLQNSSYKIAPWDPIDSLAWLKALAWDLRGNMDDELTRATLQTSGLTKAEIESLYPSYPFSENQPIVASGTVSNGTFTTAPVGPTGAIPAGDALTGPSAQAPIPAAAIPALKAIQTAIDGMPSLVGDNFPGIGSNSWVISGSLTTTGKPILANDPHLAPSMPGIWFQMGLHCTCAFNVEGFTFSGVPGVIIGHNGRISWGFTNLDPDVTDLYLEKIKGNQYEVDGQWRDLSIRTSTINVAGGKPEQLRIRTTNNGPLLSDVSSDLQHVAGKASGDISYAVALKWTALEPGTTMDAVFAVDAAANWDQFKAAAALFTVPAQNMVYADVDGNIGYQAPGQIPIRAKGDGRWPAPGWDSAYDWAGYIPFQELPSVLNPPSGYLVTANQAVIDPATYQPFLTDDWSYGYRSQRIADMIGAATAGGAKISVADVAKMQFDNRNDFAAQITPTLLTEHVTGVTAKAQALLNGWDFQQPADGKARTAQAKSSAAATYFNAFWHNLLNMTFDELPSADRPDGEDRWFVVMDKLFNDPTNAWWDNASTPQVETRDDIVTDAMVTATRDLSSTEGNKPASWRWGTIHTLYVQNESLGESGIGPIEWLFNYGPVGVSGGSSIVNATGSDASDGYTVNAVPSMRMIVDMSNLDASRWVQLTGESGHAFSSHYHDQFDLWRTGATLPMRWDEATIKREAADTLTLEP